MFEHEWLTDQLRFGGDLKGLESHLDYLQGMGIKGLYLAGSPFSKLLSQNSSLCGHMRLNTV